jgi:hypothetical protein
MFDLSRMEEALDEAEREARQTYYRYTRTVSLTNSSEYLKFDMGLEGIFPPSLESPPKVMETNPENHQMVGYHRASNTTRCYKKLTLCSLLSPK